MKTSVIKVGVAYVNVRVSRHLKEGFTRAIDELFQVIGILKQLYH